jgi:hypothetical protein
MKELSDWLQGLGIDPLLGGLVLGALLVLLLRRGGRSDRSGPRLDLTLGTGGDPRRTIRFDQQRLDTTRMHLEVDGQGLDIPPEVSAEILAHLHRGNKIEAIKRLREATGLGLAEAKQMVEALERGGGFGK